MKTQILAAAAALALMSGAAHAQDKMALQLKWVTQAQFAEAFHLPITTLRDWEQHRSTPDSA